MDPKRIAKPRDFIFAKPPFLAWESEAQICLVGMIEAAEQMSLALRAAMGPVLAESEAREAVREEFYALTEDAFERLAVGLTDTNVAGTKAAWIAEMRRVAMRLFEDRALPGLSERTDPDKIVTAHARLRANLRGQGSYGGKAWAALELPPVGKKEKVA